MRASFNSIYSHGFVRAAVCIPTVRVGNPTFNATQTLKLAHRAAAEQALLAVFPELGLSAYSNDDLFQQDALLDESLDALQKVLAASLKLPPVLVVGMPLRIDAGLFNCAVTLHRGRLLRVVPKTYLPNYREFYEKRQFVPAQNCLRQEVSLCGQLVPVGTDLIFEASDVAGFAFGVELCEDLWTPIPPSTFAALAGATVLINLSASNITVGKADYRRQLGSSHSARCVAAYLYAGAGQGESTTDLAWDGHGLIAENGELLAETRRFSAEEQLITADIDLDRLVQERMRLTSFHDCSREFMPRLRSFRRVACRLRPPSTKGPLRRTIARFPYVPTEPHLLDDRCQEVSNIQVQGLVQRLASSGIRRVAIGVSGGLDSTQALIVASRAMDRLGLPRTNVLAFTMPGFATTDHTLKNARRLMKALGVRAGEIDIRPACLQMFRDLGHPFSRGQPVHDITFENVQAGERTSHLFRLANQHQALVVGTGDLSELALGWMTYGVGDHMSHYNVNVSVPKTLIQHLIRWAAASGEFGAAAVAVLKSILETEISPELIPTAGTKGKRGQPSQRTSDTLGPYELQDFTLYYVSRYGFRPSKIAFLASQAWGDRRRGSWPPLHPRESRNEYDLATIKKWLRVFLVRFFQTSQFKRSAIPNGPKVGSGGSLSPRGDWRAPSDAVADAWLRELAENVRD